MADARLTPLDASFLHLENASPAHMHVACVMVFDGPSPPYEELLERVAARLHLVPRYRQKLASVPLGQGRPRWVDDPDFDLRYHVRSTALPRPGTERELQVLAARVFSSRLDRDKPLWEMWLVEGLEDGRFAILSKTHHAVVDGISGMDILSVLFAPDEDAGERAPWEPGPTPSGAELLAEALLERATRPAELVRPARALVRRPLRVAEALAERAIGLGAMAWAGLAPAPSTPYNRRPVGARRRFVWVRGSLAQTKEVKNSLGGSVNDVVLAIVARALRLDLERRGEDVDGLTLRAFVPMSVRAPDQHGELGNQVTGMIAPLPIGCSSPRECLHQITEAMRSVKDSGQAVGAKALTELAGFAPANLLDQGARLIGRQRFINLVVTNVPGPQQPLYLGDRRMRDIFPLVPLGTNLGLGVAIVSYNGTLNFGLVGDFDAVPDLEELALAVEAAQAELAEAAGAALGPTAGAGGADGAGEPAAERPRPTAARPAGENGGASADREPGGDARETRGPGPEATAAEASIQAVGQDHAGAPASGPGGAGETRAEHVDTGVELVAESADPPAAEGAHAELQIKPPWPGYDQLRAGEIADRLVAETDEVVAQVRLYESFHRARRQVLEATERAMRNG
ncbi:MAG: wax ester/triacylglycerol synthase family O-acyltransferase [Actinobacteria bacterium]|nr:MAG: wax ester/triacylglycerol synthase family O-acyltransferase [Actinomycetota bacterium]